jgi:hypothetical protein
MMLVCLVVLVALFALALGVGAERDDGFLMLQGISGLVVTLLALAVAHSHGAL